MTLQEEQDRATEMLDGKTLRRVIRHRPQEVLLEFTDGTRFFAHCETETLDLSITDGLIND